MPMENPIKSSVRSRVGGLLGSAFFGLGTFGRVGQAMMAGAVTAGVILFGIHEYYDLQIAKVEANSKTSRIGLSVPVGIDMKCSLGTRKFNISIMYNDGIGSIRGPRFYASIDEYDVGHTSPLAVISDYKIAIGGSLDVYDSEHPDYLIDRRTGEIKSHSGETGTCSAGQFDINVVKAPTKF